MDQDQINKQIFERLEALEKRVNILGANGADLVEKDKKILTLNEIIRKKKLTGQEKVAAIVGYQECVLAKSPVEKKLIPDIWGKNKLDGKYRSNFIDRAIKDGFLRDLEGGTLDLSLAGESFWESLSSSDE